MADTPPSHNISYLAWPDIQAFLKRSDLILIPMGSCEQHGAHLPVGMDYIYPEEVARRAAEKANVLYTPTIWMGYSPQHLRGAGEGMGTISVRPETLGAILYDVARSLIHQGFSKLVFVNGHGSNAKIIDPILRRIRDHTGALVAFYKPYAERYIGMLKDLLENPPEDTPGWHASEFETSLMMAMRPDLVRMDRAVHTRAGRPSWLPESFVKLDGAPDVEFQGYQYFAFPMDHEEWTPSGVIGNPLTATAEKGEVAIQRFADHLVDAIREFEKVQVQIHDRAWLEKV
jgi:creatinine amidohydrolase